MKNKNDTTSPSDLDLLVKYIDCGLNKLLMRAVLLDDTESKRTLCDIAELLMGLLNR